jgi:putative component of membrane protein insertase Oxa1/YidC/SpoIIIJ protein YidD
MTRAPRPASIVNVVPLFFIRLYRWLLSPILGRFCGEQCFLRFGFFKALALTVWRILRCQPLCKGGYDPPPEPDGYKLEKCRG